MNSIGPLLVLSLYFARWYGPIHSKERQPAVSRSSAEYIHRYRARQDGVPHGSQGSVRSQP